MKKLLALALLIPVVAFAGDPVTFGQAGYCPTYCTQFPPTSDPSVTIDYVMDGLVGLSVNGVVYRNATALQSAELLATISHNATTTVTVWDIIDVPYTSADGATIFLTMTYQRTVTLINSGRAHGVRTAYVDLGGSLIL